MMNMFMCLGRIIKEADENTGEITLAVNRSYKNSEGVYETDFITCFLGKGILTSTCEYCRKGDLIAVKGRIETREDNQICLIAERLSFLSSKKPE